MGINETLEKNKDVISLDATIVITSYVQDFCGTASICSFLGCGVAFYLGSSLAIPLFVISLLFGLSYWTLDRWMGEFKCSGVTNRMRIISLAKRISKLET